MDTIFPTAASTPTSGQALKDLVREKYAEIATQSRTENATSCCGVGGCSTVDYAVFAEQYDQLDGYNPDADLGLGCGLPTEFAQIRQGDTVLDLGSGAGNDCFVARALAGPTGTVIGVDMTPAMIDLARENARKLGFDNVQFRQGDIENLPLGPDKVDVVVSNCVMNLVPDKARAFAEVYRVLRPGGHFSISDVVLRGQLPDGLRQSAELYAGCVSGAIDLKDYLDLIARAGFTGIRVQKERRIDLPDDILSQYLTPAQLAEYHQQLAGEQTGILSVTVYAEKPVDMNNCACTPGTCC